ncbi:hypothetical protein KQI84_12005 [bacterium]|nr:hypothetical protein [bacterium]
MRPRSWTRLLLALLIVTACTMLSPLGSEQTRGVPTTAVTVDVIAAGGGNGAGSSYEVNDLIAQPVLGGFSGGGYELSAGGIGLTTTSGDPTQEVFVIY